MRGMSRDLHYHELLMRRGRVAIIAKAVGLSKQAVSAWERVPAERVPLVAAALGMEPWQIRPDLWAPPMQKEAPG